MKKRIVVWSLAACLAFSAVGCAPNPEQDIITGKNEGVFDVNAWISADTHHAPGDEITFTWNEEMESSDGSVQFTFSLNQTQPALDMPVVQVTAYYPTADEVKNIADLLYEGADFTEYQFPLFKEYSKSEIQEMLDRWAPYATEEKYASIFGDTETCDIKLIQQFLANYREKYETAPETSSQEPCRFTYRNTVYYTCSQEQINEMKPSEYGKMESIRADVNKDGICSIFTVDVYRGDEFKKSQILSYLSDGVGPAGLDKRIFNAALCRTEEPTEETDAAVRARAEQLLADLQLGDWYIDSLERRCSEAYGTPEYSYSITAVPVLNGVAAVPQESDYTTVYASTIAQTSVEMELSPEGEVLFFYMRSPLETEKIINDNVSVIDFETVKEKARTYFRYTDKLTYASNSQLGAYKIECHVNISQVRYGLVRIRVANQEGSYYYAPGMVFYGTVQYVDKSTGEVSPYYRNNRLQPLLVLNCVDGTIVNGTNA